MKSVRQEVTSDLFYKEYLNSPEKEKMWDISTEYISLVAGYSPRGLMLKIFCQNRLSLGGLWWVSLCFLSHNSLFHSLALSITLLTYHCHCPSLWISTEGAFVLCCHRYCDGQTNYVITISHHIINMYIP